ncbi:MAG: hypothetical protein KatS3mg033_2116 [Thermonema sp.]|uniref:hypothetical protein n=1 Tax=Thermonema sp. TaxID=2231181 RepID=UPI0021DBC765|nr:hypothetical protein [Thermonema sp.]GIV40316.1 MAG: hypothetical protein KatS3mg033_2116 [Thermonema sp.]
MKKILYTIGLFLTGAALLSSCMEDPGTEIVFDKKPVVEFNYATFSTKPKDRAVTLLDGENYPLQVQVNWIGKAPGNDVVIPVTIDEANTTGQEGVDFIIPKKEVVIPAGETIGYLDIEVIDDQYSGGEEFTIALSLQPGADYEVSKNAGSLEYDYFIACPFDINTFVGAYDCDEPGYAVYPVNFSLVYDGTGNEPPTTQNDNFWDVGAAINYEFEPTSIVDVVITIPEQEFVYGSNTYVVTGTSEGTVPNTCSGDFKVSYTVKRKNTGATVDSNIHTFTKQ